MPESRAMSRLGYCEVCPHTFPNEHSFNSRLGGNEFVCWAEARFMLVGMRFLPVVLVPESKELNGGGMNNLTFQFPFVR